MPRLTSISLRTKILLLIAFMVMVISAVSYVGISNIYRLSNEFEGITQDEVPKLLIIDEVVATIAEANLESVTVFSHDELQNKNRDTYEHEAVFQEKIKEVHFLLDALILGAESPEFKSLYTTELSQHQMELNPAAVTIPEFHNAAIQTKADIAQYEQKTLEALETYERAAVLWQRGATSTALLTYEQSRLLAEEAASLYFNITDISLRQLELLLTGAIDANVTDLEQTLYEAQVQSVLAVVAGTLLLLIIGSLFVYYQVTKPMRSFVAFLEELAKGNFDAPRQMMSVDTEEGKVAELVEELALKIRNSRQELEDAVENKTRELTGVLSEIETKNLDLERSQMATINLLEDLEEEKAAVQQKVEERTIDLVREKNKLLQVTGNMKGGGILLDENKNVSFTNEMALSILNIKAEDAVSNAVLERFFEYFSGSNISEYVNNFFEGQTFHVPEIEGGGRVYEIFFHFLENKTETTSVVTGYFILFFDITEAKLLERSKSELVAVASHQLRTPLTAMRGNVEMLVDESFGPLNKEQHELLDDIEVSTIRLITMVNEMLDITKIERGNLDMTLEVLNVKQLLDAVVNDLQAYADRHEFTIKMNKVDSKAEIYGDRMRVSQIFQNLIDNAIKYSSHPGNLTITSMVKGDFLELRFADNGIGIPKNEQSKLFGRFYRASNTAKTTSSGSGLGLYIVRSIAKQLGGDISFESTEGTGTTFLVSLPIKELNT